MCTSITKSPSHRSSLVSIEGILDHLVILQITAECCVSAAGLLDGVMAEVVLLDVGGLAVTVSGKVHVTVNMSSETGRLCQSFDAAPGITLCAEIWVHNK